METQAGSRIQLLARILMSALFVVAAANKTLHFNEILAYMQRNGVPLTTVALVLTLILEYLGGLLLIVGWRTRLTALVLAVFVVIVTPIFHGFWRFDAAQFPAQLNNFLRNLAIIGGLLYIYVAGPGSISLDARGREGASAVS